MRKTENTKTALNEKKSLRPYIIGAISAIYYGLYPRRYIGLIYIVGDIAISEHSIW